MGAQKFGFEKVDGSRFTKRLDADFKVIDAVQTFKVHSASKFVQAISAVLKSSSQGKTNVAQQLVLASY